MKASRVRRFGLVDVPGCAHGASSPGRSDRHVSDHRAVGVTRPPPGSQSARLRSSVASPLFGISAEPGPCEVSGHEAADSPKEQTTRQTPSASHPRQPLADVRGGGMQASSVRRCEPVDLPRCVRSVSSPGQSDRHVSERRAVGELPVAAWASSQGLPWRGDQTSAPRQARAGAPRAARSAGTARVRGSCWRRPAVELPREPPFDRGDRA
jgi:hypothetical protein